MLNRVEERVCAITSQLFCTEIQGIPFFIYLLLLHLCIEEDENNISLTTHVQE